MTQDQTRPELWWSPTHGLISYETQQYEPDGGVWWRHEDRRVSLRRDGFPNALPADAVQLVPVTEVHEVVCQKVAELNECYEEISRLNRELAEVRQAYDRTFNRLYDIETGAPDA